MHGHRADGVCLTVHARRRMTHRGISLEAIAAILDHGQPYHTQDGCTATLLTKKAARTARRRGIRVDQYQGAAVVESHEGKIVTVEHVSRVPRGWELAR